MEKEFQKGEILIREGDLSDCAYILESGRAEVLKSLPGGESQVVGTLEQNDIFGELGLIDGFPRSATVKALAPCRVSILTQQAFNSLARNNPQALMPILKILANRLRQTLVILDKLETDQNTTKTFSIGSV
ncbi:MAG: cyclic nucleotide-binding domain-containing protein [Nitrospina sp.]|nr:cyclic nucleotide-binding domain-containing protein [Nitrospina sp.]